MLAQKRELVKASKNGDILKVRQLLDQETDPNALDEVQIIPCCIYLTSMHV